MSELPGGLRELLRLHTAGPKAVRLPAQERGEARQLTPTGPWPRRGI